MKKLLSLAFSLATCCCLIGTTLAASPSDHAKSDSFVDIWTTLRNSGNLTVGEDGLLHIDENHKMHSTQGYMDFVELVNTCNESIRDDILKVNPNTVQVTSVLHVEDDQIPNRMETHIDGFPTDPGISPQNAAHGCSVQACDLLTMCRQNYRTLSDYYEDMLRLVLVNPNLSPKGATIGFWISKVEPGGDWDYKVRPGFAPYNSLFCCYFDSNFNHVTSEYIGNFNYGYTGSFLFDLNTLHFGSSAVAGFDPADKNDWPAIDAGYYNAT